MTESDSKLADFYPSLNVIQSTPLGNAGGLSGAELWQWKTLPQASLQTVSKLVAEPTSLVLESELPFEFFLLRKWPTGIPGPEQLSWIHRVISHAYHEGCHCLAPPIRNRSGETWTRFDGDIWEVSPWKPGVANFLTEPNDRKLENMMRTLAQFHKGAAQVNLDFNHSKNFQSRFAKLKELALNFEPIVNRYRKPEMPLTMGDSRGLNDLVELKESFIAHANKLASNLCRQVEMAIPLGSVFPVQPVLRDVWHDHVLFTGDEVTGLIDYGAMQMDIVSLDIARLLGSTLFEVVPPIEVAPLIDGAPLAGGPCEGTQSDLPSRHPNSGSLTNPQELWSRAIECYRMVRPLSQPEMDLIPWLDQASVLLGSQNWLEWLIAEGRQFPDLGKVGSRLRILNQRLLKLAGEF